MRASFARRSRLLTWSRQSTPPLCTARRRVCDDAGSLACVRADRRAAVYDHVAITVERARRQRLFDRRAVGTTGVGAGEKGAVRGGMTSYFTFSSRRASRLWNTYIDVIKTTTFGV